jgi:hypothetical protein
MEAKIKIKRWSESDNLDDWCDDLLLILKAEVDIARQAVQGQKDKTKTDAATLKTVKKVIPRYLPSEFLSMMDDTDMASSISVITAFKKLVRGSDYEVEKDHEAWNMRQSDCDNVVKYITRKNKLLKEGGDNDEASRVSAILACMDARIRQEISYSRKHIDKELTLKELLDLARAIETRFSQHESINVTTAKGKDSMKRKKRSSSVGGKDDSDETKAPKWIVERFQAQDQRIDTMGKTVSELGSKIDTNQAQIVSMFDELKKGQNRSYQLNRSHTSGNMSNRNDRWKGERPYGVCWNCREKGHRVHECPKPKNDSKK